MARWPNMALTPWLTDWPTGVTVSKSDFCNTNTISLEADDLWMGGRGLKLYLCSSQAFTDHSVRRIILFPTSLFVRTLFIKFHNVLSYSTVFCISGCVSRPTWLHSQLIRMDPAHCSSFTPQPTACDMWKYLEGEAANANDCWQTEFSNCWQKGEEGETPRPVKLPLPLLLLLLLVTKMIDGFFLENDKRERGGYNFW